MSYPVQTADDFLAETLRVIRPPHRARYRSVGWADIGKKIVAPDWLIKGLLQVDDVSILAGASQSGKSFVAIDLALAVARGVATEGFALPERMTLAVPKPRGVIYIAAESARGVVQLRLPAYKQHRELDDGFLPFEVITQPVNFFALEKDVDDLIGDIRAIVAGWNGIELGLITIDTFSASTPGLDEIKGAEISKVRERINKLRDTFGCHVQIVHHMNASGERIRGHSSLLADIETAIICAETDEEDVEAGAFTGPKIRELMISKQKDGPAGLKFRFRLNVVELGEDEDGEPITSCVCAPPEHTKNIPTGRDALGMVALSAKEALVFRALQTALRNNGEVAPKDCRCPADATVVRLNKWRDELARLIQNEDEDEEKAAERAKKTRDRSIEKFMSLGLLGKDGSWVWRTKRRVKGIDRPYTADKEKTATEKAATVADQLEFTDEVPFSLN